MCGWNAGFIVYIILVSIGAVWLVFCASRRWGNTNPLVYVTITGTIGSLSVMGCKGLGVGIKQTVAGTSQLTNPAMWIILVIVIVCIAVQVGSSCFVLVCVAVSSETIIFIVIIIIIIIYR